MKSASQLNDEEAAKYKSAIDLNREEIQRQHQKAARSQARLNSSWAGLLEDHPLTVLLAIGLFIVFLLTAAINDSAKNAEEFDAWYRAKLDCRQSGGNYEYFGTQGYHCIGGKK